MHVLVADAPKPTTAEALLAGSERIDLVVTVGSQSPLLFVLGASPQFQGPDRRDPVAPWLNLYNPRDPLSFLAAEAFAWATTPPVDVAVDDPRDLIASHTGYSTNPAVYEQIAARLASPTETPGLSRARIEG